jgi:sugar phosphate isomerase/epimerase
MKLGAYTACLHDKTLSEALEILAGLGLNSLEVNAGGFIPAPHCHVDALLANEKNRRNYLAEISSAGFEVTALNVNGNPLHPDSEVRAKHSRDLFNAIELAEKLGVSTVITMSGQPGGHPGCSTPNFVVEPWDSAYTDILDYQWNDVAIPFWTLVNDTARRSGVNVAIEMHPHNLVYNPATLVQLIERTKATHVGAEMDPSHLFWQGMDPIKATDFLGDRVFFAAAKDIRINEEYCQINGVLDGRFRVLGPDEPKVSLGGRYVVNGWPTNPSWQFVAVGRGHEVSYWADFLAALEKANPNIHCNIEHEDFELGQLEGLEFAARTLHQAREMIGR